MINDTNDTFLTMTSKIINAQYDTNYFFTPSVTIKLWWGSIYKEKSQFGYFKKLTIWKSQNFVAVAEENGCGNDTILSI